MWGVPWYPPPPATPATIQTCAFTALQNCLDALEAAEDRELTDLARNGVNICSAVARPTLPVTAALVGISTRFGVLSRHTAFFAEEERADGWPGRDSDSSLADRGKHAFHLETLSSADALALLGGDCRSRPLTTDPDPYAAAVASASREADMLRSPPSSLMGHPRGSRTKQTARKSTGGK
jgi:hypothetical protein